MPHYIKVTLLFPENMCWFDLCVMRVLTDCMPTHVYKCVFNTHKVVCEHIQHVTFLCTLHRKSGCHEGQRTPSLPTKASRVNPKVTSSSQVRQYQSFCRLFWSEKYFCPLGESYSCDVDIGIRSEEHYLF